MYRYQQYHIRCKSCDGDTTKKHARTHDGLCKTCSESRRSIDASCTTHPSRNECIIDSRYMNYAREEGHYDVND